MNKCFCTYEGLMEVINGKKIYIYLKSGLQRHCLLFKDGNNRMLWDWGEGAREF